MDGMDAERLELYEMLKPTLQEEPARRLVLALGPTPETVVTKDYIDAKLSELTAVLTDKLTWRMITIMGAWTAIGASLFAVMARLIH
jgi:recombinational DNA repair protein RecR